MHLDTVDGAAFLVLLTGKYFLLYPDREQWAVAWDIES